MGRIRGFGNIKKIRELTNKMDFHSSKGFVIYTNNVDEKRIGDILMGRLKYLEDNGKISGTTKEEVIEYMQEKFAIGGIKDFVNLKQILPTLPDKAKEMTINEYISRILKNKKRMELERTTYVPNTIGKDTENIDLADTVYKGISMS